MAALLGGPTIGHTTDDASVIRCRTTTPALIAIRHSLASDLSNATDTAAVDALAANDFVAKVPVPSLAADTRYYYTPLVDGVPALAAPYPSFRTLPTAGAPGIFRVVYASCSEFQFDPTQDVWPFIESLDPHLVLRLGDNIYADNKISNAVWQTLVMTPGLDLGGNEQYLTNNGTGYLIAAHQYLGWRCWYRIQESLPAYAAFAARFPQYFIYDDHDCIGGENRSGGQTLARRLLARQVFVEATANPYYGDGTHAIYSHLDLGDVRILLLDGRFWGKWATDPANRVLWGEDEEQWIRDTMLDGSQTGAAFQLLVNGSVWGDLTGNKNNLSNYAPHRNRILNYAVEHSISGGLLLSGDRHLSAVMRFATQDYPDTSWHDLCAGNFASQKIPALAVGPYGVLGSWSGGPVFATLDFDTASSPATATWTAYGRVSGTWAPRMSCVFEATAGLPELVSGP